MAEIRIEQELSASADAVWKLIRDFGSIGDWADGIDRCELEGEGVGCVRVLTMGDSTFRERLESLDDTARRFSYSIVDGPMPLREYLARVSVEEAGPGRSRLHWFSTFETDLPDAQAQALASGMEGAYRRMIANIAQRVR